MEAPSTAKRDSQEYEDEEYKRHVAIRRLTDHEWERLQGWPPYLRDYEGFRPEGV